MTAVIPLNFQTILGLNQEAYQELRLTLSLKLRRQLLIAVCDDVALQAELAARLQAELTGATEAEPNRLGPTAVVNLNLDVQKPDLARQVLRWCQQHDLVLPGAPEALPTFQALGIEQLTRQSPALQNRFLISLAHLEPLLDRLELRLVLWVSRPWLRKIRQSVPEVWQLRTGLFEFAGEPTPLQPAVPLSRPVAPAAAQPTESAAAAVDFWTVLTEDLATLETQPGDAPGRHASSNHGLTAVPHPPATAERVSLGVPPEPSPEPPAPPVEPQPPLLDPSSAAALCSDGPSGGAPSARAAAPTQGDSQLAALAQQIQALVQQQAGPLTIARAYLLLGQTCRDRVEAGSTEPDLMDLAIEAYQQALPGLATGTAEWCDGINDLGSLYWLRSHSETQPAAMAHWLQRSIDTYQQVLNQPSQPSAEGLARLCSNLGTVYSLLAGLQDTAANLEQAVRAYHRALLQRPADRFATEYASLQNSLGAIHWRLAQQGDSRTHLHQAITAYSEALLYRPAHSAPQEYAMIQNNLGIAYWSLAQHERPAFLLEQAVLAYQSALAYRTVAADPAGSAATQNNLGTALWDLAQHQGHDHEQQHRLWQQALVAYEAALTAANRALSEDPSAPLSFDLWATYHSAGVVHNQLAQALGQPQHEQRQQHLDQALSHYLKAWEGWRSLPDRLALLVAALVHTVRLQYQIAGIDGQNQMLSKIPVALLAEILPQL